MLSAHGTFRSTLISIVSSMLTNTLCLSMVNHYWSSLLDNYLSVHRRKITELKKNDFHNFVQGWVINDHKFYLRVSHEKASFTLLWLTFDPILEKKKKRENSSLNCASTLDVKTRNIWWRSKRKWKDSFQLLFKYSGKTLKGLNSCQY